MAFVQQTMPSTAHDELAALFSRNLTFAHHDAQSVPRNMEAAVAAAGPAFSISQHYNHSTSNTQQQQQPDSSEAILRLHGVNPAGLTPSQLQLFSVADHAQKRRLLELWSIFPPNNGGEIPSLAWSSSSIEHEEQLAQIRQDRIQKQQQHHEQQQRLQQLAVRQQQLQEQQQIAQSSEGQWSMDCGCGGEPYMSSGYEELMRREREKEQKARREREQARYSQATDPVYMGPDYARHQQQVDMASQYGAFEQLRGAQMDTADVVM